MTKRFLEVEEIQDLAGEEQRVFLFSDGGQDEEDNEETAEEEDDRKGGKADV